MDALVPRLPRAAWIVLGGDALSAVGSGLTLPFFLVYLHQVRGLPLDVAGLALSSVALAGLLGNPLGGWLSDRAGARRALASGLLLAAAGAVMIAAVRASEFHLSRIYRKLDTRSRAELIRHFASEPALAAPG